MKLYEINAEFRALWQRIAENDGELSQDDFDLLEALEIAKDEKVKAYGVVIREMISEQAQVKVEIERLEKISKRMSNRVEWLKGNLSVFMLENEMPEYKSTEVNITFRRSQKLLIDKDVKLAKKWLRTKIQVEPDKILISEFIKAGGKVKGCQIVECENIQIK